MIAEQPAYGQHPAFPQQTNAPPPDQASPYRFEVVAVGLHRPWGIAFLPDRRMLVTERPGQMQLLEPNGANPLTVGGVPIVRAAGTAGLLDVVLDPHFETNGLVYFTYLEPRGDMAGLAVARARLNLDGTPALEDLVVIFHAEPVVAGNENVGSRLLFGRDGMLYVTVGDRFDTRDQAQDLGSDLGKLIRITPDGHIPDNNPFVGKMGVRPEIYALGQRNAEGLALEPATNTIWELENGAKGGDELNRIKPGANYGWPVIAYGRGYDDKPIGVGTAAHGMEQPVYYWDPSIAPSGMTFYNGDLFPEWRGNIFLASLKGQHVNRLVLEDGHVAREERMLGELHARIRTIAQAPDGAIYVLTDEDQGRIVRILPAEMVSQN
jgi:glucose/arabinose dehydrogenase